ncbi:hypothetical protein GTQ99_23845, partial [Kineococcus sp. T13]|uniref:hypothetical protein n=1 Tax=Kineococcus vitellinus TaxID=2696565 RepID=UPI00196B65C2
MTESSSPRRTGDLDGARRARAVAPRVPGGGVRLAVTTAVVVAVLSIVASSAVGFQDPSAVVWWPAAGAALALAVRRPARRWWCVAGTLVGTVAASHVLGVDRADTAVFASAQALQCGVGGALVSVLCGGEPARLRRGRDAWRLLAG